MRGVSSGGRGEVTLAEGHAAGEAQRALWHHRFGAHRGFGLLEVGQQLQAALVERLARFGQRQAPGRSIEQADFEVRLKLSDLAGDCGRRYVQALGGGCKAAELDHLGERVERVEPVHRV